MATKLSRPTNTNDASTNVLRRRRSRVVFDTLNSPLSRYVPRDGSTARPGSVVVIFVGIRRFESSRTRRYGSGSSPRRVAELGDPEGHVRAAEQARAHARETKVTPIRTEQDLAVLGRGQPTRHRRARRAQAPLAPGEVLAHRRERVADELEDGDEGLAAGRVREVLAAADLAGAEGGRTVELRAAPKRRLAAVPSCPVDQAAQRPDLDRRRRLQGDLAWARGARGESCACARGGSCRCARKRESRRCDSE